MHELALFAGAGGGILGGKLLGWRTVCAVERDPYAASVLIRRQNEGWLEPFPVWSDVCTFDGNPWRGIVDVVSGGFPCQDISAASPKGEGIEGKRSGLWVEMARIVSEVRPKHVFVENSPVLTSRGLGRVLGDLAEMGYDARWGVVGAHHAGLPHKRDRIWIIATDAAVARLENGQNTRKQEKSKPQRLCSHVADTDCESVFDSFQLGDNEKKSGNRQKEVRRHDWLFTEYRQTDDPVSKQRGLDGSKASGVADDVAYRVDRIRAVGNGQVPAVVKLAWEVLTCSNC